MLCSKATVRAHLSLVCLVQLPGLLCYRIIVLLLLNKINDDDDDDDDVRLGKSVFAHTFWLMRIMATSSRLVNVLKASSMSEMLESIQNTSKHYNNRLLFNACYQRKSEPACFPICQFLASLVPE